MNDVGMSLGSWADWLHADWAMRKRNARIDAMEKRVNAKLAPPVPVMPSLGSHYRSNRTGVTNG